MFQDAEFVSAVREARAPPIDVETVLPTMRALQAAWEVWLAPGEACTWA